VSKLPALGATCAPRTASVVRGTRGEARRWPATVRRLVRWVFVGTAVAAALLVAGSAVLASQGRIDMYDGGAWATDASSPSPAWARTCFRHDPRPDRKLLDFCSRVQGHVLLVHRKGQEYGREIHAALIARFHLFVVKLTRPSVIVRPGATITVVGPVVRARNGLREIQAWSVRR